MTVDLAPLVEPLFQLAIAAIGFALTHYAGQYVSAFNNDKARTALVQVLDKAADFIKPKITSKATVQIKNKAVAEAVQYVVERAPGLLQKNGITPDMIPDMIRARLPQ